MKKVFSKKVFIPVMALLLCTVVAFGTAAVASQRAADINISVNVNDTVKKYEGSKEDAIYAGFGMNEWDMSFGPDAVLNTKMSDAYFEVTAQRIIKIKPKVVRFLISPLYLCYPDDEDAGEAKWNAAEKGWRYAQLNFDTPYMYNFWRYLEIFQAAGTKVMVNYDYSDPLPIAQWYCIKHAPANDKTMAEYGMSTGSIPRNLDAFANNLVAILKECEKRGFIGKTREESTIQFINFANEITTASGSMASFGDERIYYCKMLEYVHKALVKGGYRSGDARALEDRTKHRILVIGMNGHGVGRTISNQFTTYIDYVYENAYENGYCDLVDFHQYMHYTQPENNGGTLTRGSHAEDTGTFATNRWIAKYKGSLNVLIGETGTSETYGYWQGSADGNPTFSGVGLPFDGTPVSQTIGLSLGGVYSNLYWFTHALYYPRTPNFINGFVTNLWQSPSAGKMSDIQHGIEEVNATFGETGIFMRYVPADAKVARSTVDDANKDSVLLATYMNGDNTAVVAEFDYASKFNYSKFKAGIDIAERTVQIDLEGRDKNAKGQKVQYYKYVYEFPESSIVNSKEAYAMYDGNAILPDGKPVSVVNGKINDTISGNHCLVIYSTLEPAQQIALAGTAKRNSDGTLNCSDDYSREITLDLANRDQVTNGVEIKVDLSACKNIDSDDEFAFDIFRGVIDTVPADQAPEYLASKTGFNKASLKNAFLDVNCFEYKNQAVDSGSQKLNLRQGTVTKNADGISATYKCATDENGNVIAKAGDTIAVRVKLEGDTRLLDSVNNGNSRLQIYDTDVYAIAIIKIVNTTPKQ